MSEEFLSLGDRVVILENELHPDFEGQEGVIEELGAAFHFWVMMPDGIMYGFNEDELIAAPAVNDNRDRGWPQQDLDALGFSAMGLQPAADASADGVDDARRLEGLSAQIVHAQMVLQDALGYKENDYHVSLTDLAADIERLRDQLAACQGALHELRLQVIDLDGWKTEALNRGILLESFYKDGHDLWKKWDHGKGALKRAVAVEELGNVLRRYWSWRPT